MTELQVFAKVLELINAAPRSGAAEITLHSPLSEVGLDSLRLLEIVFELEQFYGIEVDESALVEVLTVSDLVQMVVATQLSEVSND